MGYWIGEFVKVLIGYIFLMYLWPTVVFRKKLAGKNLTYRFAFCSTVSILLINTIILGLGLFHILKGWIVLCIFYGVFLVSVLKERDLWKYFLLHVRNFFSGTQGWKTLILRLIQDMVSGLGGFLKRVNKKVKGRRLEYGILSVLLGFAVIYFSYGAFNCHSYGWGDMEVHHAWIYGLKEGQIFSAGVYPEAMHCFIYAMNIMFGIPIYSCLLFLGEIHVVTLLVAVYCLLREVMKSKYTAYFILTAFLTLDVVCIDEIYGISRLQYTIPQEFGLYTQFLCALYLIRFLKRDSESDRKFNDDLFLFMTALASSLAIHFYVTIMAFFLCASFAVFGLARVFRRKKFFTLIIAVIVGGVISTMPMVLAFASGIPLQGSLNWGMNIINGTDTKEGRTQAVQSEDKEETAEEEMVEDTTEEQTDQSEQIKSLTDVRQNVQNIEVEKRNPIKEITEKIKSFVKLTYSCGYVQLYGIMRAGWLIKFTLLAVILTLINMTVKVVRFRKFPFEMYAGITFASVLFMILYAAPFLGLPEIIAGSRLCLTEQILLLSMMALSVDEIFFLLSKTKAERLFPCLTLIGVAGIYAGTNYFGVYHGYLYYELTRYNSVVELTNEIIKKYPQYNYTIISTTEELYQVIEDGRHEELLDFHNKSKQDKYIIPTEYLFFYVEKNPIKYAQYHFFDGPRWLAQAKYIPNYKYSTAILSEGDDIKHSKIAEKYVDNPLEIMGKASDAYTNIKNRRILESELYYWCQNFKKRFPNEMKVYYEDEDFICYIVKQNPEHLYDLGI